MLKAKQHAATVDDFRALPAGPPYYQLINGELIMSPSPSRYHQKILLNLALILGNYLKTNPIGEVYTAPFDVYLTDDNAVEPDIVYVANANAHILTEAGVEGAPDLVAEILAPSTGRYDREDKRKVYAQTGVKELWLIFPKAQKIEVYYLQERSDTPVATHIGETVFSSLLFPGLELRIPEIFQKHLAHRSIP
jgi:Uma2 family endonuclease